MANILDIASYSETEQKAINQLINNNGGFYSSLNIADIPFSDIVTTDNNGIESVVPFFEAPITVNDKQLNVTLKQSREQKCWFICVEYNGDAYNGIVHYNCILNCFGSMAFMLLNSNNGDSFEDITSTLQYTNFLVMDR